MWKNLILLILFLSVFLVILNISHIGGILNNNPDEYNNKTTFHEILKTEKGNLLLSDSLGNLSSNKTIAVIIGVHPHESEAHELIKKTLEKKSNKLKFKYQIYKVNTTNISDYSLSRRNGESIGKSISNFTKNKNYDLVIDIHSHDGRWDYKDKNSFIFSPSKGNKSEKIAKRIIDSSKTVNYYFPSSQTSPQHITLPIANNGTPTILFELYENQSLKMKQENCNDFIDSINNLP